MFSNINEIPPIAIIVWFITYIVSKFYLKKKLYEKKKIRLGVNIDHVATLENARNENFPDLIKVVDLLHKNNVDLSTVHLERER